MRSDKNKYAIALIALLVALCACKKDELSWMKVRKIETGTNDRLNRILLADSNSILVFGGNKFLSALIISSRDGGHNWQHSSYPSFGKGIYGAAIAPNGQIYGVGFQNEILKTRDTGRSFTVLPIYYDQYFIAAAFPANTHGLIISTNTNVSGAIVHIDSAGNTLSSIPVTTSLNDVHFTDSLTGYLAGYGVMMKTRDGGYSWQYEDIHEDDFKRIFALDKTTLYTCGWGGSIFTSGNSGDKWTRLRNGDDLSKPRYHLTDILMLDKTHGYCVGENGLVIYTDDGGDHWSEIEKFTSADLISIALLPDGDLLICGDAGSLYRLQR